MHIWEGIYSSFAEAGGSAKAFRGASWVERSGQRARDTRVAARSAAFAPPTTCVHEYCLPLIASVVQATRGHVRILDFGGAAGQRFHATVDVLARADAVEVHVVDNENLCARGREVFEGEARIFFHPTVPERPQFDIVHLGSSVQYLDDWLGVVRRLVVSRPTYLVFDDVPAGDIPTFVSLQNDYGRRIPHRFFNIGQFVRDVEGATGYKLFYKARYVGTFLGDTGPAPMSNFPEDHRIDNAHHLAFVSAG
jgi:putative methyltransferase (TIGR04325 family)